jgi:hypothetical protein
VFSLILSRRKKITMLQMHFRFGLVGRNVAPAGAYDGAGSCCPGACAPGWQQLRPSGPGGIAGPSLALLTQGRNGDSGVSF